MGILQGLEADRPHLSEVSNDAPALHLRETDVNIGGLMFRVQEVQALTPRGTRRIFEGVLGLASEFFYYDVNGNMIPCGPLEVPGAIVDELTGRIYCEYTVGQLKLMAQEERYEPPTDENIRFHMTYQDDLITKLDRTAEEALLQQFKTSTFGPNFRKERR